MTQTTQAAVRQCLSTLEGKFVTFLSAFVLLRAMLGPTDEPLHVTGLMHVRVSLSLMHVGLFMVRFNRFLGKIQSKP